jgi:hypothetical protein
VPLFTPTKYLLLLAAVGLAAVSPARASVIDEYTTGATEGGGFTVGQSFTTPSGGPWDDITFSFFVFGNAFANGTAYIFSAPYTSTPDDLSAATDLATSTGITSDAYVFDSSFTLQPNTTYYLYTAGEISDAEGGSGPGGGFGAASPTADFTAFGGTGANDYKLSGVQVSSVPEPSKTGLSLLCGAFLLFAQRRLRFSA